MMFLAVSVYFQMVTIMRFLSNTYIAAYRNVPGIMNNIRGIIDKETCDHVEGIFKTCFPTNIDGHRSCTIFMNYKNYGNKKSVLKILP